MAQGPPVPDAAAQTGGKRPGHILVAEDNPTNQLIVAAVLRRAGHAVDLAGDGAEAVSVLLASGADLVLMDVRMPGLDGFEAARAIRALGDPWSGVPIIALTADSLPETRQACLAAGMNDHVAKPINPPSLLAAVDRWLAAPPGGAGEHGTDAAAALDTSALDCLAATLPDADRRRIIDGFLADLDQRLCRMKGLKDGRDLLRLAGEAHDLSSTAGSFGGTAVMRLASRIEIACRSGEGRRALALLPTLLNEAQRLKDALRDHSPG